MQNSPKWLFMESQNEVPRDRLIDSLNSLNEGLMIISSNGLIEYANSQAMHFIDKHDIQGKPVAEKVRLTDPGGKTVDLSALFAQTEPRELVLNLIHDDQARLKLLFVIIPIRSYHARPGGHVIVMREIRD